MGANEGGRPKVRGSRGGAGADKDCEEERSGKADDERALTEAEEEQRVEDEEKEEASAAAITLKASTMEGESK